MSDSVMLVCAVLASLAAGVFVAYSVCLAIFGLFRVSAPQPAEPVVKITGATSIVEG